jgi:hypothetical protein
LVNSHSAFSLAMALLLVAGFIVGLYRLLPGLAQRFRDPPGGWRSFAKTFAAARPPTPPVSRGQSVVVGHVLYRNCTRVSVSPDGLHLSLGFPLSFPGRPPLLIPWSVISWVEECQLLWKKAVLLRVEGPDHLSLILPEDLAARAEPFIAEPTEAEINGQ